MNRLYLEDSYRTRIETEVVRCEPVDGGYAVRLRDDLLFPGGGGQPRDHGTIAGQAVRDIQVGGDKQPVYTLDAPVDGVVTVALDWPRRLDCMQQHTAQHLITSTAGKEFGLRTVAFHIGEDSCDIEFANEDLTEATVRALETRVNEEIRALRAIRVEQGAVEDIEHGEVRSRRLAKGVEGPLRIIVIEGWDRNTCGGTHVANTGELQLVKLLGMQRLTRAWRVFYAAGERVRRAVDDFRRREEALTALLTCHPGEHAAAVEKLQSDLKQHRRQAERLREELAAAVVERLAGTTAPGVAHHFDEASPDFLRNIAQALRDRRPETVGLFTAGRETGIYVLIGPPDRVEQFKAEVATLLAGRGGGRDGLVQGRAGRFADLAKAQHLVTGPVR